MFVKYTELLGTVGALVPQHEGQRWAENQESNLPPWGECLHGPVHCFDIMANKSRKDFASQHSVLGPFVDSALHFSSLEFQFENLFQNRRMDALLHSHFSPPPLFSIIAKIKVATV